MARQKQTAKLDAEETATADAGKEIEKDVEPNIETGKTAENARPTPEPSTEAASDGNEDKAQPDKAEASLAVQQTVNAHMRRFVVLKPVRFQGKRIPRGRRATLTRAGHDELASLGAVSSVWDHGTPVEAA